MWWPPWIIDQPDQMQREGDQSQHSEYQSQCIATQYLLKIYSLYL